MENVVNNVKLEDKKLANDILERKYYKYFREGGKGIELFLTGICKANCEYCYLKAHQKELYPTNIHNYDTIINNLKLILNWYKKNHFCCNLDIFSAEWITTPLFDRVLDTFYEAFKDAPENCKPKSILTADNMQFFKDEKLVEKLEWHIARLKSIGIDFCFSISVDGKYCDYGRTENDDEYYKRLNDFMLKYHFRAHPMISSSNISYWIDNYKWWQQTFDKKIADELMTLEVRDGSWTEKSIADLIQYCDFLTDDIFYRRFKGNKKEFLKYVFHLPFEEDGETYEQVPYNVLSFNFNPINANQDAISCSMPGTLMFRVGDLTTHICHRLAYDNLEIGKWNVVNGEIVDFEPTNVSRLLVKTSLKKSVLPHCENCKFNGICIGHCFGASYEEYGNMLVPQKEVCEMYQAKYTFLFYKFIQLGILDELEILSDYFPEKYCKYLIDLISDVVGGLDIDDEK